MKKSIKIVSVALMMLAIALVSTSVFAGDLNLPSQVAKPDTSANGIENVKTIGNDILGIIRVVGTIVAVGMLIVLGIKYMMGSAEERAEYKKTLFPYFVGAVLIFAASSLTNMIYNWASALV